MKTKILLFFVLLCTVVSSCKKDEESPKKSPYTEAQQKVLNLFKGKFQTAPDLVGNISTIVFLEQFDSPKTYVGRNMLGDKTDVIIHGIYKDYYTPDTDSKYRRAYHILDDGTEMRVYFLYDDNTISLNSKVDKYTISILSSTSFKLRDYNFPLNPDTYKKQ